MHVQLPVGVKGCSADILPASTDEVLCRLPQEVQQASKKSPALAKRPGRRRRLRVGARSRAPQRGGSKCLDLVRLKKHIDSQADPSQLKFSLRPHFFPGGILRRRGANGSVILFDTASYVIVGAKTPLEIKSTYEFLCAITSTYVRTSTRETSCAQIVHM